MFSTVTQKFSPNLFRRVLCDPKLIANHNCYCSKQSDPLEPNVETLLKDAATFHHEKDTDWATTPYPVLSDKSKNEKSKKPLIDPKDTSVLIFPGQGTLKVGKISEYLKFPRVKDMFEIANEALGYNILSICKSGPTHILNQTQFNQPATVLTSLAAVEKLQEERPLAVENCVTVAGYSVGELTALIFSGSMNFESGIRLVGVRAAAMQKAANAVPQAMISAYCTPQAKLTELLKEAENWALDLGVEEAVCRIAIYLYTQCKIIAGNEEAIKYIERNGQKFGLRKIKRINVSGAFHTPLMKMAEEPFREALQTMEFHEPIIPTYSNVTGDPHHNDAQTIKKLLRRQLTRPVKWEQIMQKMYQREPGIGFPRTFDVGSAGSMKAILRNVNAKAWEFAHVV